MAGGKHHLQALASTLTPLKAPLLEPGTADVMGLSLAKDERKELRQSPKATLEGESL